MKSNFKEIMKQHTNSELLEILTKHKQDYQPEAILAAEEEFSNRNLTTEDLNKAKEDLEARQNANKQIENASLGIIQKLLFLVFCWGVIPWLVAGTFRNKGYEKKYKDAWTFMKIGFLVHIGLIIILAISFK